MKRYLVQTFGCQMNVHDSRRIEDVLRGAGYEPTDEPSLAHVLVVNTCSVRDKAEHKLMSLLGTLRPLKEMRPNVSIAVAGCVAQQEGERLIAKAPYVDVVLGPDNIPELPRLLEDAEQGAPPRARTEHDLAQPQFLLAQPRPQAREVTGYVTVMKGCDERCTFCVVPTTRGSERYRPADSIVTEIRQLVDAGVREVTLLGQTVNSWYAPRDRSAGPDEGPVRRVPAGRQRPPSEFPELLRRIAGEVPELLRLRYTSPHPRHVTPALVRAHAELAVLPAHVHLPVQSGSDRMLKRMLRRYSRGEYLERARALMDARPGLTLSTDIIVGFPGETEDDFRRTLSLVREAGFVQAFCFKYSPRPYTPAQKLDDDVPDDVKTERLERLFEVVEAQQAAHLQSLVGTRQQVLVEGHNRHGQLTGRTGRHEVVHLDVPEDTELTGALVDVTIARAHRHSLLGRVDEVPTSVDRGGGRRVRLPVATAP